MSAGEHPFRSVPVDALRRYMHTMLCAARCDEENAGVSAEAFLDADLRVVGPQGLDHMPTLLGALRDGRVNGRARPRVVEESPGAGLGFSDVPPMVRPHGGTERRLGTNPMSIAIPTGGDPPVLDLSTGALSDSRVRQAGYHGESGPGAEGVDSAGSHNPHDPRAPTANGNPKAACAPQADAYSAG